MRTEFLAQRQPGFSGEGVSPEQKEVKDQCLVGKQGSEKMLSENWF